jgi:hypothetical protein
MKAGLYCTTSMQNRLVSKQGLDEKMRKVGSKGAPTAADFKQAAKTAKKPKKVK